MNCTHCGAPLRDVDLFCPNCGQKCGAPPSDDAAPETVSENPPAPEPKKRSFLRRNWLRLALAATFLISVSVGLVIFLRTRPPKPIPTYLVFSKDDGIYLQLQSMKEPVCILESDEAEYVLNWNTNPLDSDFYLECPGYQLSENGRFFFFLANYDWRRESSSVGDNDYYSWANLYVIDLKSKKEAKRIEEEVVWFSASRSGKTLHYLTKDHALYRYSRSSGKSKRIAKNVVIASASLDGRRLMLLVEDGDSLEFRVLEGDKVRYTEEDIVPGSGQRFDAERDFALFWTKDGEEDTRMYWYSAGKSTKLGKNLRLTEHYYSDNGVTDEGCFYYWKDGTAWYWDGKDSHKLDAEQSDGFSGIRMISYSEQTPAAAFYSKKDGIQLYLRDKCIEISVPLSLGSLPYIVNYCIVSNDRTTAYFGWYSGEKEIVCAADLTEEDPEAWVYEDKARFYGLVGRKPLYVSEKDGQSPQLMAGRTVLVEDFRGSIWKGMTSSLYYLRADTGLGSMNSIDLEDEKNSQIDHVVLYCFDGSGIEQIASGNIETIHQGIGKEIAYRERSASGKGYFLTWRIGGKTIAEKIPDVQSYALICDYTARSQLGD